MLGSCVSSRFLQYYCEQQGFKYESTPTGFKNLGNAGLAHKAAGRRVLFAFEEAIGFQVGDWNFDKDGITALMTMTALLGNCESLEAALLAAYNSVGLHPIACNSYLFCRPASRIPQILEEMRSERVPNLKSVAFKSGVVINNIESTASVLQLDLSVSEQPGWLMIRSSGTEPKIKFYSELFAKEKCDFSVCVYEIIDYLLQPNKNNLQYKSD